MPIHKQLLYVLLTLSLSSLVYGGEVVKGAYDNGVTLTLTTEPFDAKAHVIKKCGESICLIDGKPFYGSDGTMPTTVVSRLVFERKGKQVALDVSSMYNPAINSESMKWSFSVESGDDSGSSFARITGYFSDGAGAYLCQWLVIQDGSIRNHISNSEEFDELNTQINNKYNQ